ncbi:hypothetical protein B0H13DRAFT_2304298 [Mycena leptocephala]|nr:hypothetical protein B0H13DRAFT_2304298 [Mycena leptocephala]
MFSAKLILTALAFAVVAAAAPSSAVKPTQRDFASVQLLDLTGGLDRYNDQLSWAQVPPATSADFDCSNTNDFVALQSGNWDLFNVQAIFGSPNFNDLTSSISCSPV